MDSPVAAKLTSSAAPYTRAVDALHETGEEMIKKEAVDHFAGKEKELQSAMQFVSGLKQKYSKLSSLSEIPKRVPNPMHGKPLLDRLAPGIGFQVIRTGSHFRIDLYPSIGYRFNGKLTGGAGWSTRIGVHHLHLGYRQHVYGPRAFANYKIKGGLYGRIELETMHAYIPPMQGAMFADAQRSKWIWNSFVGIKKDYYLFTKLKGCAFILINANSIFDKHHINLYGDPLTGRVGFELLMRGKRKN